MKYHFIGIGGIGLSALARFLKAQGHEISGSDIAETTLTSYLKKEGIKITIPHDASAVTDQDVVIYSAVIKPTNPEMVAATKKGIKALHRRDALPLVLGDKKVYSVCGAHGKSTTTAMLAAIMEECSALIGAESKQFGSNMRIGSNKECVVFESDESDESFLFSNPHTAIVPNAEPEHLEYYKYDLERFYGAYRKFLESAKVRVINAEDEFLSTLSDMEAMRLYPSRDIEIVDFVLIDDEPHTKFRLKNYGEFDVWGFGAHIALDASLAIMAASSEIDTATIKKRLLNYKGIKKRFDIIYKNKTVVIDDYGHHPTEIESTLKAIEKYASLKGLDNITTIWQPHKYSRTVDNMERFRACFKGSKRLVILPVWAAGEEKVEIDFANLFNHYDLQFADSIKCESEKVLLMRDGKVVGAINSGLVVGFGAGDITYQLRGVA